MKKILASLSTMGVGLTVMAGNVLAQTSTPTPDPAKTTGKGISISKPKGFATNLGTVISGAINLVFMVAALIAFGFLIFGGIEWITSGGDKGKTEGARNKITAAVVGLLILAASWAIINFTLGLLGFNSITDVMNQDINLVGETKK